MLDHLSKSSTGLPYPPIKYESDLHYCSSSVHYCEYRFHIHVFIHSSHIRLSPNFFSEGTVTNLTIWLVKVVSAVRIFLSAHGHGNLKRFRESPSTSLSLLPFFINISRFSGWAVFFSKDVGYYLKLINNLLLILFFLSLKSL